MYQRTKSSKWQEGATTKNIATHVLVVFQHIDLLYHAHYQDAEGYKSDWKPPERDVLEQAVESMMAKAA